MSAYNDTAWVLTIVSSLYTSYLWLIYFAARILYLISFTNSSSPAPILLFSGNHLFLLCIYDSISVCSFAFKKMYLTGG